MTDLFGLWVWLGIAFILSISFGLLMFWMYKDINRRKQ